MKNYDGYLNQELNFLTIKSIIKRPKFSPIGEFVRNRTYFKCLCICGEEFEARADHVLRNSIKSCGCKSIELTSIAHKLPDNQAAINVIFKNYKSGAVNRELDFNLSIDEFKALIFKNCYYCGIEPKLRKFKPSKLLYYKLAYNGIDRINSLTGYILENCVPCCRNCNYAKSDLSLEEFNIWIERLVNFQRHLIK